MGLMAERPLDACGNDHVMNVLQPSLSLKLQLARQIRGYPLVNCIIGFCQGTNDRIVPVPDHGHSKEENNAGLGLYGLQIRKS